MKDQQDLSTNTGEPDETAKHSVWQHNYIKLLFRLCPAKEKIVSTTYTHFN